MLRMNLKVKSKDIKDINELLSIKAQKRRIRKWIREHGDKLPTNTDNELKGDNKVIYDSRKLLRLFDEEQQIHQLTIRIDKAYRGLNVVGGHTWGICRELIKIGLIEISRTTRFMRTKQKLDYYVLTPKGWEIAHPIIYPPNLHEEQKAENVVYKLLNESQPKKLYAEVAE